MTPAENKSRRGRGGSGKGRGAVSNNLNTVFMHEADFRPKPDAHYTPAFFQKTNLTDRQHAHTKKERFVAWQVREKGRRKKREREMKSALLFRTRVLFVGCLPPACAPGSRASSSCCWWWERKESVVCRVCLCVLEKPPRTTAAAACTALVSHFPPQIETERRGRAALERTPPHGRGTLPLTMAHPRRALIMRRCP